MGRRKKMVIAGMPREEFTAMIAREYLKGATITDLAARYTDIGMTTINTILKDAGIKLRPPGTSKYQLPKERVAEMCDRYNDGASLNDLVRWYGGYRENIAQLLEGNGVTLRTREESRILAFKRNRENFNK